MKIKEYKSKYINLQSPSIDEEGFEKDFNNDFIVQITTLVSSKQLNHTRFKSIVTDAKKKFDAIFSGSHLKSEYTKTLWNRFYALCVVKFRDKYVGEEIKQKQAKYEERQRQDYDMEHMFDYIYAEMAKNLLNRINKALFPEPPCFKKLGLTATTTQEEIKKKYTELVFIHHPDKGGKTEDFIEITKAKDECLKFIGV